MLQQHSTLLRTPTELRHEILMYLIPERLHVRFLPQGYLLSHCLGPCEDGVWEEGSGGCDKAMWNADVAYMKTDGSDLYHDQLWARRLQSSWGFHCKCEEIVKNNNREGSFRTALLFVCKTM